MTLARRLSVPVLLATLLWVTSVSAGGERFQICSEEVFPPAGKAIETCRPLAATDASFLIGLLLALAPLAPDVQRLQVGTIVSIERRLQASEMVQEGLRAQVEGVLMQQSVRQEQHQHVHLPPYATSHVNIRVAEDELRHKEQEFLRREDPLGDR